MNSLKLFRFSFAIILIAVLLLNFLSCGRRPDNTNSQILSENEAIVQENNDDKSTIDEIEFPDAYPDTNDMIFVEDTLMTFVAFASDEEVIDIENFESVGEIVKIVEDVEQLENMYSNAEYVHSSVYVKRSNTGKILFAIVYSASDLKYRKYLPDKYQNIKK